MTGLIPGRLELTDIQQAIREVWDTIGFLSDSKNIDLRGRRIINAGDAVGSSDYVTRGDITGAKVVAPTRNIQGASAAQPNTPQDDTGIPGAPYIAVVTEKLANGTYQFTFGADLCTTNRKGVNRTQFQIAKGTDDVFAAPVKDETKAAPDVLIWSTTEVNRFLFRARQGRITANTSVWGVWADVITATTEGTILSADTDIPSEPRDLAVIVDDVDPSVDGKELVITWKKPASNTNTLFAYAVQIHTSAIFPTHAQLLESDTGSATRGDFILNDPNANFRADFVKKTLWIHSEWVDRENPPLESTLISTGVIEEILSPTSIRLSATIHADGDNICYQIIVPDWEQVLRSYDVPTKILDQSVQDNENFKLVVRGLPFGTYYVRVKGANNFGIGPWTAVSSSAVVDGIKQADFHAAVSDVVDNASKFFSVIAGTLSSNSPSAGHVAWAGVKVSYAGTSHVITNGNTTDKFIYWQLASPTVFQHSASLPSLGNNDFLVGLNASGTFVSQYNSTLVPAVVINGQITETQITDLAISTPKLAANAVTAAKIYANTITANEIATNTITTNQIASHTITAANIAALTITAGELAANSVTAGKIAATAIDAMTITGATIRTAANGARAVMNSSGLYGYDSGENVIFSLVGGVLTCTGITTPTGGALHVYESTGNHGVTFRLDGWGGEGVTIQAQASLLQAADIRLYPGSGGVTSYVCFGTFTATAPTPNGYISMKTLAGDVIQVPVYKP